MHTIFKLGRWVHGDDLAPDRRSPPVVYAFEWPGQTPIYAACDWLDHMRLRDVAEILDEIVWVENTKTHYSTYVFYHSYWGNTMRFQRTVKRHDTNGRYVPANNPRRNTSKERAMAERKIVVDALAVTLLAYIKEEFPRTR